MQFAYPDWPRGADPPTVYIILTVYSIALVDQRRSCGELQIRVLNDVILWGDGVALARGDRDVERAQRSHLAVTRSLSY